MPAPIRKVKQQREQTDKLPVMPKQRMPRMEAPVPQQDELILLDEPIAPLQLPKQTQRRGSEILLQQQVLLPAPHQLSPRQVQQASRMRQGKVPKILRSRRWVNRSPVRMPIPPDRNGRSTPMFLKPLRKTSVFSQVAYRRKAEWNSATRRSLFRRLSFPNELKQQAPLRSFRSLSSMKRQNRLKYNCKAFL